MKTKSVDLQSSERQIRNRKVVIEHDEQSGLLNRQQQSNSYQNQSQQSSSFGQKLGRCTLPLVLTFLLSLLFSVIVYRYFFVVYPNSPNLAKGALDQSLVHEHLTFEHTQSQKVKTMINQINEVKIQPENHESNPKPLQNELPLIFWTFESTNKKPQTQKVSAIKDYHKNRQHYAQISNIRFSPVSLNSSKTLITSPKVLEIIQKFQSLQIDQSLKQELLQLLVMLSVLEQHGGIAIGGNLILTQSLDSYLKTVDENPQYSLFLYMDKDLDGFYHTDLKNYFFMAKRQNSFMNQFIIKVVKVLESQLQYTFNEDFDNKETQQIQKQLTEKLSENFINLLNDRQSQPDKSLHLTSGQVYVIGHLSDLSLSNSFLLNITSQNHFKYLYSIVQQELQQMIGPVHSIVNLAAKLYEDYVSKALSIDKVQIIINSFIQKHLLSISMTEYYFRPIKFSSQQNPINWELPQVLWTFVTKDKLSNSVTLYFLENLLARTKSSNLQLVILTESNLKDVFEQKQHEEIKAILQKIKLNSNNQHKEKNYKANVKNGDTNSDFKILQEVIKLKIIKKYGGIFVDFSYFLLENLDWLQKISSNKQVFNKNQDSNPQVFMFHRHSDFPWSININSGVKQSHNLNYLTHFIAAFRNSQLIQDWLDEFDKNIQVPQEQLQLKLQQECQIKNSHFQNILQNSLQCLMKRKKNTQQKQSDSTLPAKSYKLWSINSLFAGDKIDLVIKTQHKSCFYFNQSQKLFTQNYGTIGYVSRLISDASKQQIQKKLIQSSTDSIARKFFIQEKSHVEQIVARQQTSEIKKIIGILEKTHQINSLAQAKSLEDK